MTKGYSLRGSSRRNGAESICILTSEVASACTMTSMFSSKVLEKPCLSVYISRRESVAIHRDCEKNVVHEACVDPRATATNHRIHLPRITADIACHVSCSTRFIFRIPPKQRLMCRRIASRLSELFNRATISDHTAHMIAATQGLSEVPLQK